MTEKVILNPKEAAAYLGISKSVMYDLLRSDGFPVLTLGKKLKKVLKSELDAYLQKKSHEGGA